MIPKEVLQHACEQAESEHGLKSAEHYLNRLKYITFGIEHVSMGDREISYINLGDTYDQTVIKEGRNFFVGSWGSWLEDAESQYCDDNDEINCSHCGNFTPRGIGEEWSMVICQNCGHLVGG